MPLANDIEEFRRILDRAVEELEEVREISDKLTEYTVDEIYHQLTQLQDLCEQASIEIKRAGDRIIEINARWGSEPLKSWSNSRAASSDPDTLNSLIDTNSFFVNAIQLGLPTEMALDLANVPGDSYIVRNLITDQPQLLGTASLENPETALHHFSRIWVTTALGDQGELFTWKELLESGIPQESILVKPHLTNQLGETACPDFYCEAERLICDAKAWKKLHSLNNLQQVVNKYATCFEGDGEVRLYFPSDLYEAHQETLNQLSSPNPSVKVTICSIPETHKDLEWRKRLFYTYIKLHQRK